jgi:hypothetical protein
MGGEPRQALLNSFRATFIGAVRSRLLGADLA